MNVQQLPVLMGALVSMPSMPMPAYVPRHMLDEIVKRVSEDW